MKYDDEAHNYKLEFDFGDDKRRESGELVEFEDAALGPTPSVDRKCMSTAATTLQQGCAHGCQPTPSCTFKAARSSCSSPWGASR